MEIEINKKEKVWAMILIGCGDFAKMVMKYISYMRV
jgi:hypothetical protein